MDTRTVVKGCLKTGISLFLLVGLPVGATLVATSEPAMANHRRARRPQPPRPNQSDTSGNRPGRRRGNPFGPGSGPPGQTGIRPGSSSQRLRANAVQLQQAFGG